MTSSRFFTVLAGAVLALGALATPAAAHDVLVSSDPADGATLAEPPASVVLEFSGEILDLNPAIEVTHDGETVEVGEARIDGTTVAWELTAPESLEAGEYAVVWAVTSQDGHPIDGSFGFVVDAAWAPGGTPTPEPSEPAQTPEASPSAQDGLEDSVEGPPASEPADLSRTAEMWFLAGLVVTALVVGGVVVLAVRRNRDPNGPPGQH